MVLDTGQRKKFNRFWGFTVAMGALFFRTFNNSRRQAAIQQREPQIVNLFHTWVNWNLNFL
jgi:hypothetical protein